MGLLSFVSTPRLEAMLDYPNENILLSRVTPDPADDDSALVKRFSAARLSPTGRWTRTRRSGESDLFALEGYIVGRFVIDVLERMPRELTR